MILNKQLLKEMVESGMVRVQKHPYADLWIYNYTQKCQFERCWNEVTLQCRGLILDGGGNVVARPFRKFFNYEELNPDEIPNLPFDVFEKMDGSLGILYWLENTPFVATRGSFESEQAIHATRLVQKRFSELGIKMEDLHPNSTYLFEIVYPENRIVVDYGDVDTLFLLAVIDNDSGKDLQAHGVGFPLVKAHHFKSLKFEDMQRINENNAEGFVVRFSNGFRMKIKFEDYKRLHKILTGVSTVTIWEHLSLGKPLDEILESVPDEFYDWVKREVSSLLERYTKIEISCRKDFVIFKNRKEAALYYKTKEFPHILFKMLDGKDYSRDIWKLIRPVFSKPFTGDNADEQ